MLHFARWKITLIVATVLVGLTYMTPNFLSKSTLEALPDWMPSNQMVLGLDLQGGAHILLQIEKSGIVDDRLQSIKGEIRSLLREDKIGYTGLKINKNSIQVRIRDTALVDQAVTKLETLEQSVNAGLFAASALREVTIENSGDGIVRAVLTEEGINARVRSAVDQSIEVIRRRIDELGTTEPIIQREGADRILVQIPGLDDSGRLKEILKATAKLEFRMIDQSMSGDQAKQTGAPIDSEILSDAEDENYFHLVKKRAVVGGDELEDSQQSFDQRTNEAVVTFRFNTSGARKFAVATSANVGRPFAIVLDGKVISAPVIQTPIIGGSGQITGNFTPQSANDLAILLRAGALPAELTIVEERSVGPGLGADSVASGKNAGIIGAIAVLVFMFLSYGVFGLIADIALVINVALLVGVLSMLGATLTLPGIAGIVLTVGMAVDANVLIYERIREEARAGRSAIRAIDAGFSKALGTILDANITTMIAAVILFWLGSGPIRGFAITLAIGILTTVFTAFTLTRFLVAMWVKSRRPSTIPM